MLAFPAIRNCLKMAKFRWNFFDRPTAKNLSHVTHVVSRAMAYVINEILYVWGSKIAFKVFANEDKGYHFLIGLSMNLWIYNVQS